MRQINRGDVEEPEVLNSVVGRSGKSELEHNVAIFNGADKNVKFKFNRYSHVSVKRALEELFHGKCAYCESFFSATQPVDVEHYRPKGKVADSMHGGYWWLAADWDNLLPSCIDCNRKRKQELPKMSLELRQEVWGDLTEKSIQMGKKDSFPLKKGSPRAVYDFDPSKRKTALEKEERLLLDPTRDDPKKFVSFNVGSQDQYSLVLPWAANGERNERGHTSIKVYGLNRLGLVQARTRVLRDLEFLLEMSINLKSLNALVTKRKTSVEDTLQNSSPLSNKRKSELESEVIFFKNLSSTIITIDEDIFRKIEQMMSPKAPFCSLVRAWRKKKIQELSS